MTTPQPAGQSAGTPPPSPTVRGVHLPNAGGKKPSKKTTKRPAPKPAPKRGGKR